MPSTLHSQRCPSARSKCALAARIKIASNISSQEITQTPRLSSQQATSETKPLTRRVSSKPLDRRRIAISRAPCSVQVSTSNAMMEIRPDGDIVPTAKANLARTLTAMMPMRRSASASLGNQRRGRWVLAGQTILPVARGHAVPTA